MNGKCADVIRVPGVLIQRWELESAAWRRPTRFGEQTVRKIIVVPGLVNIVCF